jgi:hypothetical protein
MKIIRTENNEIPQNQIAHVPAIHQFMQEHKVILTYEGNFTQPIIINVLQMAEKTQKF